MDQGSNNEIKVFKYRWIALIIFCLCTIVNFMQFLQFSIISNVITKYYDIDSSLVDLTGLIFFVVYIILFLPVSYLIEKFNLKVTAVVSTGFTLAGTVVKLFCSDPSRFYIVLIGQGLCAVGQVYLLSIPSKFASVWFGADQVSTACAIAVLGTQLGAAIGSILPPFLVEHDQDSESIGDAIHQMAIYNVILACVVFIVVVVFFKAKPQLPPSQSQLQLLTCSEDQSSFFSNCKTLFKNRDFLLVLQIFGIFNGLWNSFGILVNNIYINYFPEGQTDIGIITLLAIIAGGCIGSVVFGFVLDQTHEFKKTSIAVLLSSSISFIIMIFTLSMKYRIATYFTIPLFGFFIASSLVLGFEYALEVTYPIPESTSCSVLNATIFVFSIIATLAIEGLIDAIGYLYTFVIILVVFILSTINLYFISPNLRRRNANLNSQEMHPSDDII
ncbi:unnamed protein product [Phaedon cochleariae]|uniref:Major facilitator superfamily (MFS) profile domain-containing protein n=1 Tax=Phaedon cochleariae TaxID=80249 RepID=A0A9N9SGD9_PHACE|nr:unnamed protein product [Phaedon cochleariae]